MGLKYRGCSYTFYAGNPATGLLKATGELAGGVGQASRASAAPSELAHVCLAQNYVGCALELKQQLRLPLDPI